MNKLIGLTVRYYIWSRNLDGSLQTAVGTITGVHKQYVRINGSLVHVDNVVEIVGGAK